MTPSTTSLLEQAKQGNPKAIATLVNHHLKVKGIRVVKATLSDHCFMITLEASEIPNQELLVVYLHRVIRQLQSEAINKVKIYGRQTGVTAPIWYQEFDLTATSIAQSQSSTKRHSAKYYYALSLFVATAAFIGLSWVGFPFSIPLACITGIIDLYLFLTSADYQQQKQDVQQHKEARISQAQWNKEALAKAQELKKLEQEQHQIDLLLDPQKSPIKQIKTKLPFKVFSELRNLQTILNEEISATDLNLLLNPVRDIVQDFNLSSDAEISRYFNQLIDRTLLCYEVYLECIKAKEQSLKAYHKVGAISQKTDLGKLIAHDFPELKTLNVADLASQKLSNLLITDLSDRYYDFPVTINTIHQKATHYIDQIRQILGVVKS